MRILRASLVAGSFAGLVLPTFASPTDDPGQGFSVASLPVAPPIVVDPFGGGFNVVGLAATRPDGSVVTFDGLNVELLAADGTPLATLGSLSAQTFPGFLALDPNDSFVVVGESSGGDVFRYELDASGGSFLANLPGAYDAAFSPAGELFVSASTCGFGCGNEIWTIDCLTGAKVEKARVSGPSGPITFDGAGHLYYATQSDIFPTPPGSVDIVVFLQAALSGADCALGTCLGDSDALTIMSGFDGGNDLVLDPLTQNFYLAINNFGSGVNRIVRAAGPVSSQVVVEGTTPFRTISGLEIASPVGQARLLPFQPASGGALRYTSTDFFAFSDRAEVRPERPIASLSGPGTAGAGSVTYQVDGGPVGGFMLVLYGPSATYDPIETALLLPATPPLFSGLDPLTVQILPLLLPLDGTGKGMLGFNNPGGAYLGLLALQATLLDPVTFQLLGNSTAALL